MKDPSGSVLSGQAIQNTAPPLIVVAGPTAIGKSALSVALAKRIGGEIISADSMQVYRGMDIGSAKLTGEEMDGVPHYLIDVLEPEEPFDVFRFQQMAKEALGKILSNGHIPIIAGGTGFYIQSVVYDIAFGENDGDDSYRRQLERLKDRPEVLHRMLEEADPESAAMIHQNNVKRTIRALEYFHQTGQTMSEHNREERERTSPYNHACFVLTDDREKIYERIDRRVDEMMRSGLLDEVIRLKDRGLTVDDVSMKGLGYAELLHYLGGDYPLEEAVRLIKRNTRHFAKRQLTWFRREKDVIWLNRRDYDGDIGRMLDAVEVILREKGILDEQMKERRL